MNKIMVCIDYNSFSPYRPSDGTSDEANKIHSLGVNSFSSFYDAVTLSSSIEIVDEILSEIYDECNIAGWDGYDADPVSEKAITNANKLLRMLPSNIPIPRIVPEPSGGITLRWKRGRVRTLVIAVYDHEMIDFAAVIGIEHRHGRTGFNDFLPRAIPALLQESKIANEP